MLKNKETTYDDNTGEKEYQLACTYKDSDLEKRFEYLTKASEKGHVEAQFELAVWYDGKNAYEQEVDNLVQVVFGASIPVDLTPLEKMDTAIYWYEKAGEQGHIPSQYNLGFTYTDWWNLGFFPKDCERRRKLAVYWLTQAASMNFAPAQFELWHCYSHGEGVKANKEIAYEFLEKAAKQGHKNALRIIITDYEYYVGARFDIEIHIKWCEMGIEYDMPEASRQLGDIHYWGKHITKNEELAYSYYKQGAEQGDMDSQYMLGICYYFNETILGKDMPQEERYKNAALWYEKAAEQGHTSAQRRVGKRYYKGEGVEKDEYKAFSWFQQAAKYNDIEAEFLLAECYLYGEGTNKDDNLAYEFFERAAQKGHTQSQLYCGEYLMFQFHMMDKQKLFKMNEYDAEVVRMLLGKLSAKEEYEEVLHDTDLEELPGVVKKGLKGLANLVFQPLVAVADGVENIVKKRSVLQYCVDARKALEYYRLAADQGCSRAKYRLKELEG